MQGNLRQIQLPEVLQFISMGKSSGLLTIRDPRGAEITLAIRNGKIINSSALDRRRRLGELLVHRGILRRSVLSQLLALQRTIESDKRLGQILVERDIITENTIREVLRLQLEEEIWNLFGLEEGEFKFEQATDQQLGEAMVQMDIEPLLLEGTRRQDEWRKIVRLLPNEKIVLGVRDLRSQFGDDERLRLTPAEWKVLAQVNGRFPIRAIVNRSGMGRFEVYQIVASLINRGVVYIKDAKALSMEGSTVLLEPAVMQQVRGSQSSPANQTSGGVGGLFSSLLKTATTRRDAGEKMSFVSPVGSLSYFINRTTETFFGMREMKAGSADQRMVETMWIEMLIGYVKADLVTAERNMVNADRLESYIRLFEFSESTQDCYEDSLEALLQLFDQLYRYFVSQVGEKTAARTVKELLDDIAPRITHTYGGDMKWSDRVQGMMRSAA